MYRVPFVFTIVYLEFIHLQQYLLPQISLNHIMLANCINSQCEVLRGRERYKSIDPRYACFLTVAELMSVLNAILISVLRNTSKIKLHSDVLKHWNFSRQISSYLCLLLSVILY